MVLPFQKLSLVLLPTFLTLGRPREFVLVSLGNVGITYTWLRWRRGLAFPKFCISNSQYCRPGCGGGGDANSRGLPLISKKVIQPGSCILFLFNFWCPGHTLLLWNVIPSWCSRTRVERYWSYNLVNKIQIWQENLSKICPYLSRKK